MQFNSIIKSLGNQFIIAEDSGFSGGIISSAADEVKAAMGLVLK
jgi:uncharacterized FAD-dependent dehydrogenase